MREAVTEAAVDPAHIHTEMFGARPPINPGVVGAPPRRRHPPEGMPGIGPRITFARSGLTVNWSPDYHSILELAEACDVPTRYACRNGVCHTCLTPVIEGTTTYSQQPLEEPPAGAVLTAWPDHAAASSSISDSAAPDGPSPPTKHGISGPEEEPQENQIGIVTVAAKAHGTEDADTRVTITCRARAQRITRTALAAGNWLCTRFSTAPASTCPCGYPGPAARVGPPKLPRTPAAVDGAKRIRSRRIHSHRAYLYRALWRFTGRLGFAGFEMIQVCDVGCNARSMEAGWASAQRS